MVELQIVILAVAGSSPVGHPIPRPKPASCKPGRTNQSPSRNSPALRMDGHAPSAVADADNLRRPQYRVESQMPTAN